MAFGDDGVDALKARNWTLTGAVLVALGVVSDLLQIFGRISVWGLSVSLLAMAVFGAIVIFRLKWKRHCVAPLVSSILFVVMFTTVLFIQNTANAQEEGVIAKTSPQVAALQRVIFVSLVSLEEGQEQINAKIDRLTEEIRQKDSEASIAAEFVGAWVLQNPALPNWVLEYRADGTYLLTTPDGVVGGVYKAADGWFSTSAPSIGSSDAGSYQFLDDNTLQMTGKLGVSVWKRKT